MLSAAWHGSTLCTGRRHVERPSAPAAHAGLGIARVVVGHHGVDDDGRGGARELFHLGGGALDLLGVA